MQIRTTTFKAMALAGAMGILPAAVMAQTATPPADAPAAAAPAAAAPAPAPAPPPAAPAAAAPAAPAAAPTAPAAAPVYLPEGMKVGAVVQLQSGGPKMTVTEIVGASAKTQWQEEKTGKLSNGEFPVSTLKVVKAEAEEDDEDEDEDEDEDDASKTKK